MPPPRREDLWSQGRDETVEVNQRALIDSKYRLKPLANSSDTLLEILARYSGEHTSTSQKPLFKFVELIGQSFVNFSKMQTMRGYVRFRPFKAAGVFAHVQAEHVQVRFYTQTRLDAIEADKNGDKGEGPSRLPDAKKDNVSMIQFRYQPPL